MVIRRTRGTYHYASAVMPWLYSKLAARITTRTLYCHGYTVAVETASRKSEPCAAVVDHARRLARKARRAGLD
jgi:hypothetical protein